jgi:hypothetical protein
MATAKVDSCAFTIKLLADTLSKEIVKDSKMEDWKTEYWFYWPPDIFALTSIFLKSTGIYRYMMTPHPASCKRLHCGTSKKEEKRRVNNRREWYRWLRGEKEAFPEFLNEYVKALFEDNDDPIFDGEEYTYDYCDKVLRLHAIADDACPGFGLLPIDPYGPISAFYFLGNYLLGIKGTLSRLPKHHGIVLPKMHTPQRGLNLRCFHTT